ncbi:proline iminopeptidase [Acrasis kona]|uniref:Proline iminopeptidase n=1 Tax=Acrasis kona TaxID=1008807 RepID=A0AAW2YQW1_9EUKA
MFRRWLTRYKRVPLFQTPSRFISIKMTTPLRELYPPIDTYDEGTLKVSDVHTISYEQSGNPEGKPVVVLHGGPGGGCDAFYRQFFDAKKYRIILFDQRGSGKSTPSACLEDNTTWHLVEDIELLRKKLNIDKWVVFGGSWGSTLALSYANKHVDRVKALVLRGIFTLRRKELTWFYQEGASFLFPEAFEKYMAPIPEVERFDLMSAYYRRLTNDKDRDTQIKCAKAWTTWEMTTSRLHVDQKTIERGENEDFALKFARIECHYFVNGGFFDYEGQLIAEAKDVLEKNKIPGVIVQGRYDVVCPAISAYDLHKQWPTAEYYVIADAGHSCKESGIIDELIKATDKFADL